MEIKKHIDNIEDYTIFAKPSFLTSLQGVKDMGYLVEDAIVLPYVILQNKFLKTLYFPVEILGENDANKQKIFIDKLPLFVKENFNITLIRTGNTAVFDCYPKDENIVYLDHT